MSAATTLEEMIAEVMERRVEFLDVGDCTRDEIYGWMDDATVSEEDLYTLAFRRILSLIVPADRSNLSEEEARRWIGILSKPLDDVIDELARLRGELKSKYTPTPAFWEWLKSELRDAVTAKPVECSTWFEMSPAPVGSIVFLTRTARELEASPFPGKSSSGERVLRGSARNSAGEQVAAEGAGIVTKAPTTARCTVQPLGDSDPRVVVACDEASAVLEAA